MLSGLRCIDILKVLRKGVTLLVTEVFEEQPPSYTGSVKYFLKGTVAWNIFIPEYVMNLLTKCKHIVKEWKNHGTVPLSTYFFFFIQGLQKGCCSTVKRNKKYFWRVNLSLFLNRRIYIYINLCNAVKGRSK